MVRGANMYLDDCRPREGRPNFERCCVENFPRLRKGRRRRFLRTQDRCLAMANQERTFFFFVRRDVFFVRPRQTDGRKMGGSSGARNYSWTLNNWTEAERDAIDKAAAEHPAVRYLCYGVEVGENGTPHLQGYVQLGKQMTFVALKKILGSERFYMTVSMGSDEDNVNYTSKEGDWVEFGNRKEQGRRTDCRKRKADVLKGTPLEAMVGVGGGYQADRHGEMLMNICEPPRTRKPVVTWIWGPKGTHKGTRLKSELADCPCRASARIYVKSNPSHFWLKYDRHDIVVLRGFECPHKLDLRNLFGSQPMIVENKGGSRQMVAERVFVLTERSPHALLGDDRHVLDKIDKIIALGYEGHTRPSQVGGNIDPDFTTRRPLRIGGWPVGHPRHEKN